MPKSNIIDFLANSKERFLKHLRAVIKENSFNYKTFGTQIEDYILDEIITVLKEGGYIKTDEDFKKAENKNQFPELKVFVKPTLAIEVKSGNHSKKTGSEWEDCKNSNNDMGTLN